jgi:hypothetical protein
MNRKLNEALDKLGPNFGENVPAIVAVKRAARWAASFPTDEQVEAAAWAMAQAAGKEESPSKDRAYIISGWYTIAARAALGAVALDPKERNE